MNANQVPARDLLRDSGDALVPPECLPPDCVEIIELRSTSIERRLGYFRTERFVIFGYSPSGGEVIWRDGHSSGFGLGGWIAFLQEIAPLASRCGVNIGDMTSVGTHVLLVDRIREVVYAAPRESARDFLAQIYGIPSPERPCLCTRLDRASSPVRTCPDAGSSG